MVASVSILHSVTESHKIQLTTVGKVLISSELIPECNSLEEELGSTCLSPESLLGTKGTSGGGWGWRVGVEKLKAPSHSLQPWLSSQDTLKNLVL